MPANPKIEPIEKTGLAKVYTLKEIPEILADTRRFREIFRLR
jgi:hypothetical protein